MQVKNVVKRYKTSSGEVQALKGVSFDLPSSGMVFVLGKSGCGKSTLLNVLSGLDNFDDGDIIYGGKSIKNFTQSELDGYRNSCCGFVFQEYNLIPELNVKDNVALAIEMQGEKGVEGKVAEALKKVGLSGYESRKITELSGGQKQRIAIARSIVKEPKIIFADEPSGALDSDTGESIFALLKELSQNTLVIVVSHDKEFAQRYGDRIIELSDGKVVSDSSQGYVNEQSDKVVYKKPRMPFKSALKIGCSNFKYHPVRLLATIILAVFSFTFLGVALNPIVDDIESITYSTMQRYELSQSAVFKNEVYKGENQDDVLIETLLNEANRKEVEQKLGTSTFAIKYLEEGVLNVGELPSTPYYTLPVAYTSTTQSELTENGFSIIGAYPQDGEVAITEFFAGLLLQAGIIVDEELQTVSYKERLIGKKLKIDGKYYAISGIVDTGFNEETYAPLKEKDYEDLSARFLSEVYYSLHNVLFLCDEEFTDENEFLPQSLTLKVKINSLGISKIQNKSARQAYDVSTQSGIYLSIAQFVAAIQMYSDGKNYDVFTELKEQFCAERLDEYYDIALQNGYVGKKDELLNNLFSAGEYHGLKTEDIYTQILTKNADKFTSMSCALSDDAFGTTTALTIKGFFVGDSQTVIADSELYNDLYDSFGGIYRFLVIKNESSREHFVITVNAGNSIYRLRNFVTDTVLALEDKIDGVKNAMTVLAIVFAFISILLLLNFMLSSVNEKSNIIGILKSLGSSNGNLIKIFIIEGLVIGLSIFIITLFAHALLGWLISSYFSAMFGSNIYVAIFGTTPLVSFILFATITVFSLMGCILPIVRLSRLKPMQYLNKVV